VDEKQLKNIIGGIHSCSYRLKMRLKVRNTQIIRLLLLSTLLGGSLSVLTLFNLPLFYEQDKRGWLTTFLITFVIFSLAVAFSFRLLLITLNYFREKNTINISTVIFLSLLLAGVFYFTGFYYWSKPTFQRIEICYESNSLPKVLKLNSISDHEVGGIYSAKNFGQKNYPLSISANTCITGGIRTVQKWRGIIIDLEEMGISDTLKVDINGQTTVKSLADNDGVTANEIISVPASSHRGSPIYPQFFSSGILIFIKWVSLLLSSVYLAMLIFALGEIIIFAESTPILSYKAGLVFVLYFLVFGFIMVNHGGQPDQTTHVYYSSRYADTWGMPKEDPESYYYTTDNEYLYYWINGKAARLYHFLIHDDSSIDRLIWRLISMLMSTGTLYYIYKLTSKVTGNRWGGVLAAFFCANTLMFVFISGGVSYDNMMSLASAAALYHLICLLQQEDYVKNTAGMGIWLCLGSLAKNQVALLAFILFWVWLVFSIYKRKTIQLQFSRRNITWTVLLALLFGLFLQFYGGNLIKYHRPIPSCSQVKDPNVCTAFSYRREQRQKVDYKELWGNRNEVVGPFEYALNYWLFNTLSGIWGIISHKSYVPRFIISLHGYLILWAAFCLARYWKKEDVVSATLLFIVLSYAGYVFFMNYNHELHYNFRHYAVQGRYLFPVFGAFLALVTNAFLSIRPLFLKRLTLSLAIILYFAGGLGTFIFRYSDVFNSWRIYF
jgi:hypothetical protein